MRSFHLILNAALVSTCCLAVACGSDDDGDPGTPVGGTGGSGAATGGSAGQGAGQDGGGGSGGDPGPTYTEAHYVTQDGAGNQDGSSLDDAWSVEQFNDEASWSTECADDGQIGPNDVVYLSGTITTTLEPRGSGNAADGAIVIDGYEAGDCDHLSGTPDENGALLDGPDTHNTSGVELDDNDYIVIQDLRIQEHKAGVGSISTEIGDVVDHATIRRVSTFDCSAKGINFTRNVNELSATYLTIEECLIKDTAEGDTGSASSGITIFKAEDVVLRNNYILQNPDMELVGNGQDGMVLLSNNRVLIEGNRIRHCSEDAIDVKDDIDAEYGHYIIRYNHLSDTRQSALTLQDVHGEHAYVYGNLVDGTVGDGVRWSGIMVFRGFEKTAIWSNVIHDVDDSGVLINDQDAARPVDDAVLHNNTIVGNRIDGDSYRHGGIALFNRTHGSYDVRNNILVDNATWDGDNGQLITLGSVGDYTTADSNLYHLSGGQPPRVYWNVSSSADHFDLTDPVSGTAFNTATGQGARGRVAAAQFVDLPTRDLRLSASSPARDTGESITGTPSWWSVPTIQGVDYSEDVGLHLAIDPNATDWSTTPPTVVMVDQDDHGSGWERGAYAYVD